MTTPASPLADYDFKLDFKVRDYECDIQGIVNNSVYQNYLEHARHEFLLHKGVSFTELAKNNVNLVVTRAELLYKNSLYSGDAFWVGVRFERKGRVRFHFHQGIYRAADNAVILTATIEGTSLNERGRPFVYPGLDELL